MEKNTLPIHKYQEQIVNAIKSQPVVIISGKTGCGKSTQVSQFILKANSSARITICEPRRLAATSLAVRVSEQYKCPLGSIIGYHIGMDARRGDKTQIVYMTYGILIQELMFKQEIPYTHILLDEVHERSLEMDFAFVALRTIINKRYKEKIKLIIMSATLNTKQFSSYFSTHQITKLFFIPKLQIEEIQIKSENYRRGRNTKHQSIACKKTLKYSINAPDQLYRNGYTISLPDENLYRIEEYFLDDIHKKSLIYQYGEEARASDEMYETALELIKKNRSHIEGDILVFIPGLFQIKFLKTKLIKDFNVNEDQIIEVHSIFSEELYWRLFDKDIKNKIILATNMGESSITLPNCKVVIDFCLSRKNFANKIKGTNKFETRLASKANLTQRSGRVGRVSDGVVYRLITKSQFNSLSEFDIPEIKCVTLQMVILKAKQLDLVNGSNLFQNPYQMLLSVIDPPQVKEIDDALACLFRQEALVGTKIQEQQINYQNVSQFKLTNVGEFMVSMPCDLKISKMILFGLKLRIPNAIIGIASILMCQKPFFAHQQKRKNIQEFLHALIGYDEGNYNDFSLRQNLFDHWCQLFYYPFKQKKKFTKLHKAVKGTEMKGEYNRIFRLDQDSEEEVYRILQEFNQEKYSEFEQNWCLTRGVYPNCMRQILKIKEGIKIKIQALGYSFGKKEKIVNELVLLCLAYAFPNNQCQIRWELSEKYLKQIFSNQSLPFYVEIPNREQTSDQNIRQFCKPETAFTISISQDNKTKRIYGKPAILSKFLLPVHYSKANWQNTSPIYKFLANKRPFYYFNSIVSMNRWPIIVLNESVNKANIRLNLNTNYFLITTNILESKEKKMIGSCALLQESTIHIIELITKKNVLVCCHPSFQFFSSFKIEDKEYQFSSIIRNEDLNLIAQIREISKRQKNNRIVCQQQEIKEEDRDKLISILKNLRKRPQTEPWEELFLVDEYKQEKQPKYYPIQMAPKLEQQLKYYKKYFEWKTKMSNSFSLKYRSILLDKAVLICNFCKTDYKQIIEIQNLSFFNFESKHLNLNPYSGSWKIAKDKLTLVCRKDHKIGKLINDDYGELIDQNIYIYLPVNKFRPFSSLMTADQLKQIELQQKRGGSQFVEHKNSIDAFTCIFCYHINEYNEKITKQFHKSKLGHSFWKKIFQHMGSKEHNNNYEKFVYFNQPK